MSLTRQDIENWVPEPAPSKGGSGLVAKLFTAITKLMASLTKISSEANIELHRRWRNEYERFFLWGQGLSVADGDLDEVLALSKELQFQVLSLLHQVGTAAIQALSRKTVPSSQVLADECDSLRSLLAVTETTLQEPGAYEDGRPNTPSDVSECEETEIIQELAIYIDCLLDLSSSLEKPAFDLPVACAVESRNDEETFNVSSEEALIYCRKIRDRFEALPKYLVERLATANVSRFTALRDMRSRPAKQEVLVDNVVTEKLFSTTDFRFTETTQSKATPSSVFSASLQPSTEWSEASFSGHTPIPAFNGTESDATFASFSTLASSVNSGRPRVPAMPERQGDGFDCPFCFSRIRHVESRKDWKKHVFDDLKPYICTVRGCKITTLYSHIRAWARHEYSHSLSDSLSPECPFCSAMYQTSASAYYKHVSRHLQEVSLSVLPQSADDEESGPAASSESSSISELPKESPLAASLLRDLGKLEVPRAQDSIFPLSTIPFPRNELFYGRETELAEIRNHLNNAPSGNELRSFALHGLGGVGKTQIALAYAYEQMDAGTEAILWLDCESERSVARSFNVAALLLSLPDTSYEGTWEEDQRLVLDWLHRTSRTWLCVLDNVGDYSRARGISPTAPSSGQVLITCRNDILSATGVISIKPFDRDQGCQFILRHVGQLPYSHEEVQAARQLADRLYGLPFALVSMAAHIRQRKLSISSFLKFYEGYPDELNHRAPDIIPYQDTLSTVWRATFEQLSRDTRTLLGVTAYLAPDCVPQDLFRLSGYPSLPEALEFCRETELYNKALHQLFRASLVKIGPEKDVYSTHRLVQKEFRSFSGEGERREAFTLASYLLNCAFPTLAIGQPMRKNWPVCKIYAQHVLALCAASRESKFWSVVKGEFETFAILCTRCSWYFMETGAWSEGILLVDTAIALCDDKDGWSYAALAHCRAAIETERAHCAEAYKYMEPSLEMFHRMGGKNHPEMGYATMGYASLILQEMKEGACDLAIDQHHKALMNLETSGTAASRAMAMILNSNIAQAHLVLKQYGKAIQHAEESRIHAADLLGDRSYYDGLADYHVGNALFALDKYSEAEKHWLRAFNIFSGENLAHPSTNAAQIKLSMIRMKRGEYNEAMHLRLSSMLQDVLRVAEQLEHAKGDKGEVARVQRKLAEAYQLKGETAEAEILKDEAEQMRREIQGDRFSELPDCDLSYAMMSYHAYCHIPFLAIFSTLGASAECVEGHRETIAPGYTVEYKCGVFRAGDLHNNIASDKDTPRVGVSYMVKVEEPEEEDPLAQDCEGAKAACLQHETELKTELAQSKSASSTAGQKCAVAGWGQGYYQRINGVDLAGCKARCLADSKCLSYSDAMKGPGGNCYLFEKAAKDVPTVSYGNWGMYDRNCA
ncbi:hypothetical protein ACJZ2D_010160 [Fusarium nematophilum]